MKYSHTKKNRRVASGVTLIEMTVVIVVLLLLTGVSIISISSYRNWTLASQASSELRVVYNAQRTYLSENPTLLPANLTPADIVPYLSTGNNALPIIEDLDGRMLMIDVTVSPPIIVGGYDPSGSTTDGLWDVGNL